MPLFNKICILYGTETGNSQDLSKIIAWQLSRLQQNHFENDKFTISVMSCDDYPIEKLQEEKFILIICSTSGLGEAPLNMRLFWRFIMQKNLPKNFLQNLQYSVIGLGDSSYAKYNYVAKKLFKRLWQLGATKLLDLILGDEQHEYGPYFTIDPWLKNFYQLLLPYTNLSLLMDDENLIESSIKIIHKDDNISGDTIINGKQYDDDNLIKKKYDQLNPFKAKVIDNKRLTSDNHFQDVRLIELQLDSTIDYNLTDICVVYPENSDEQVEEFLQLFTKINGDEILKLKLNQQQYWIPQSSYYHHLLNKNNPCSIREIVRRYIDINSIPKRSFFELFYRFSQDQLERSKLKHFSLGIDGLDDLYDYVNRPKRTILEVMSDFPNTTPNVPFEYLFDLIPSMSWRSYSIASTPLLKPRSIQILYAVVEYRTRLKKPRQGQCTTWMSKQRINLNSYLNIFLRTSTFKLPEKNQPLIMIAAGAGVAPFRAFIHDRCGQDIGDNYLFFGCRYPDKDYYLQDEWQELIGKKLLTVYTAFSREDPDKKIYVQHVVWEHRQLVFKLFTENNAIIMIAGKSKQYPELVRETLVNVFKEHYNNDEDKLVENLISKFELQKRIQFECW